MKATELLQKVFEDKPKVRVKRMKDGVYKAYVGRKRVGAAVVYGNDSRYPGQRYIWKSVVDDGWQRMGVATAMYDAIANDLKQEGLELIPSPGNQLSDDGFNFWMNRDEEKVKNHSQYKARAIAHHEGSKVEFKGRPVVLQKAINGDTFSAKYLDMPEGSSNSKTRVGIEQIQDQLSK